MMMYKDLSKYEKARFDKTCTCKICNSQIYGDEPFEMIKRKVGRCTDYAFIHSICIFQPKEHFNFGDILHKIQLERELERR